MARPHVQFRLRISQGEDIAVGPGKMDLLEAIDAGGSITAAAKALGCRIAARGCSSTR